MEAVLVDTGATRLCLPSSVIDQLGLPLEREIDITTATGPVTARLFKRLDLTIAGRTSEFTCVELPAGSAPLLGLIPLEELGLQPDVMQQRLIVLPDKGRDTYHMVL